MGSTRRRRKSLITMLCIIPERPRVHIRMKVLLRRITETPLLGLHGNDLHLCQKPKLGGRYADILLIYISYLIGRLYIHISLSFVVLILFLLSKTQKDQKDYSCFSFVLFWSFLLLW